MGNAAQVEGEVGPPFLGELAQHAGMELVDEVDVADEDTVTVLLLFMTPD